MEILILSIRRTTIHNLQIIVSILIRIGFAQEETNARVFLQQKSYEAKLRYFERVHILGNSSKLQTIKALKLLIGQKFDESRINL